jgi:hypothetical protein
MHSRFEGDNGRAGIYEPRSNFEIGVRVVVGKRDPVSPAFRSDPMKGKTIPIALLATFSCLLGCQPLQAGKDIETVSAVLELDPKAPDREMCASLTPHKEGHRNLFHSRQ